MALYHFFGRTFRQRRMRRLWDEFAMQPETRVLDVGGTPYNWSLLPASPRLALLNIDLPRGERGSSAWLVADGRCLPFADGAFDVVYSNSVIEHLESLENQRQFAAECRRVGRRYYVQTPSRWFPVEPYLLTPLIHWLPRRVQRRLLRYGTVWGLLGKPSPAVCDRFMQEIRLLGGQEFRQLFPDAVLWRERFLGLTKSLIAVRLAEPGEPTDDPRSDS